MVGLVNDARQILLRPTTVAMATEFGTKSAITRPIYEISRRSLCITWVFGVGLLNDARQIILRPTSVAMATKLRTKSAITRPI